MINLMRTALIVFLLAGCSSATSQSMPYKSWHLGFSAPTYMEVWIETADVIDIHGQVFRRAMSGTSSIFSRPNNSGNPQGWPKRGVTGKGKHVTGADLPEKIYVRWQSLVEPQTYKMVINITDSDRELMLKSEKAFCAFDGKWITEYRSNVGILLVPGGIAKVWIGGSCLTPIEIATVKAQIDPRGPYEGKSGGHHRPLSPVSKAYVEKFGVPYDSWK